MNSVRKCLSEGLLRVRTGGICHGLSLRSHRLGQRIPSLFIVSLPRSFSSYVYALARGALMLQEPTFTTFGEILNFERFPDYDPIDGTLWRWFTRPEQNPVTF